MLQHWGTNPTKRGDDQTAVVAALSFWDYSLIADVQGSDTYKATGRCFSVAAGRISYTYSLKGGVSRYLQRRRVRVRVECRVQRYRAATRGAASPWLPAASPTPTP